MAGFAGAHGSASLPTSRCPVCHYEMDAATCVEKQEAEPSAGDLSVCLNCGAMLQFNDILVLKPMPSDLALDTETRALLERASKLIKQRGRIR